MFKSIKSFFNEGILSITRKEGMKHKVVLTVPSTVDVDKEFDNSAIVDEYATKLSLIAGGATIVNANGCYVASTGELVKEKVTEIQVFCENAKFKELKVSLETYASEICEKMSQECVKVEIDGACKFI